MVSACEVSIPVTVQLVKDRIPYDNMYKVIYVKKTGYACSRLGTDYCKIKRNIILKIKIGWYQNQERFWYRFFALHNESKPVPVCSERNTMFSEIFVAI